MHRRAPQFILPENIVLMPLPSYAPVLRIGTRVLMVAKGDVRVEAIGATGSHVPHKSLKQVHVAFMPDAV